ncbi:MAG: prephenate dehydrogenase/arogenate dehydrogenase family protein [Verrucomicrobiota bacterium]
MIHTLRLTFHASRIRIISIFHLPSSIRYASAVHLRKISIIGVGLLGGSIGLAVRRRKLARQTAGFVRRRASLKDCERAGAVDFATTDLLASVWDADLVILCTPLSQMRPVVERMLPALKPGAMVTDVGSVKASVVRELESLIQKAGAHFVGSHPMAGAEKTGVSAARADLFERTVCVVTPTRKTNRVALKKLKQFWSGVGSCVLELTPEVHDLLVSRSSHLPHIIAATLASQVLNPGQPKQQAALCANGFRDTTRIASGSPEMWRDIALANRGNLAKSLATFIADLEKFRRVLKKADAKAIATFFETAKLRRDHWCAGCASPSPE